MSFSATMRARLLALLLIDGRPLRKLSATAGRTPVHYERRLGADPTIRLSMDDVDEILRLLGRDPSVMDRPVVLPEDAVEVATNTAGAATVERLRVQGLVTVDAAGVPHLTESGRALLG